MEENKKKTKIPTGFKILMILGPILMAGGITMIILGPVLDIMGLFAGGGFAMVAGFAMTGFGYTPLLSKASIKMNKYVLDSNKEDLKDISSTSADISSEGIETVTSAVRESWEKGEKTKNFCSNCGAKVGENENFCSYCGKNLKENN